MDEGRFQELSEKRFDTGLTDEEAEELGRMMAEREGKPYHNADDLHGEEDDPRAWKAEEERVKQETEAGEGEMVDTTEEEDEGHQAEETRAVGTDRQPVAPAGAGYAPPKGSTEPSE
jgi:hypothetical protein